LRKTEPRIARIFTDKLTGSSAKSVSIRVHPWFNATASGGNESFDDWGAIGTKSLMAEEATQTGATENTPPAIDIENLKTMYANVCRIVPTPAEIIVDFGMNPNFFAPVLPEPLKLDTRVIMSPDGAKRLALHLAATIASYEATYGVIELDVTKRIKQPAK
jgi:hypothetical protein